MGDDDRLFVPLRAQAYAWYRSGEKHWELRRYGRQYTERHVWPGRRVELRCGYSDPGHALWGTILAVQKAENLELFFDKVPFAQVLPTASTRGEAMAMAVEMLNIDISQPTPVLGFEVRVEKMIVIPLSAEFVDAVREGRKTSTIRRGRRAYPLGRCVLRSRGSSIPVMVTRVRHARLAELTDVDAGRDGFSTREELLEALLRFHPTLEAEDEVTIVEFELGRAAT